MIGAGDAISPKIAPERVHYGMKAVPAASFPMGCDAELRKKLICSGTDIHTEYVAGLNVGLRLITNGQVVILKTLLPENPVIQSIVPSTFPGQSEPKSCDPPAAEESLNKSCETPANLTFKQLAAVCDAMGLRPVTEAEWEHVARAGRSIPFNDGIIDNARRMLGIRIAEDSNYTNPWGFMLVTGIGGPAEWTSTCSERNRPAGTCKYKVVREMPLGYFRKEIQYIGTRFQYDADYEQVKTIGRCAQTIDPKQTK